MWYNCGPGSPASPESWHGQQGTCYARSADGYRWEKPDINGGTNRVTGSLAHDGNTVRTPSTPPHFHELHHCTTDAPARPGVSLPLTTHEFAGFAGLVRRGGARHFPPLQDRRDPEG